MGALYVPLFFCPFLLTCLLVGWATCCIWEGNWWQGSSEGDWESGFIKWNAEDYPYYYFLWHSGWCWLTFLKLIISFSGVGLFLVFLFDSLRLVKVGLYFLIWQPLADRLLEVFFIIHQVWPFDYMFGRMTPEGQSSFTSFKSNWRNFPPS